MVDLDLQIDRLQVDNLGLKAVRIQAGHRAPRWRGRIDSPDLVGTFACPMPATAAAHRRPATPRPAAADRSDGMTWRCQTIRQQARIRSTCLDSLQVGDLQINQAQLGEMHSTQRTEGLRVTRLSLRGGQVELDSAGHWAREGGKIRPDWADGSAPPTSATCWLHWAVAPGGRRGRQPGIPVAVAWPSPLQAEASTMKASHARRRRRPAGRARSRRDSGGGTAPASTP